MALLFKKKKKTQNIRKLGLVNYWNFTAEYSMMCKENLSQLLIIALNEFSFGFLNSACGFKLHDLLLKA